MIYREKSFRKSILSIRLIQFSSINKPPSIITMNINRIFLYPLFFCLAVFVAYFILPPSEQSFLLLGSMMALVFYYGAIQIKYGVFALFVFVVTIQLYKMRDELEFQQSQAEFYAKMKQVFSQFNSLESSPTELIPKNIIQIWVQKDGGAPKIPQIHLNYIEQIKQMHPDYQHLFFEEKDIAQFFQTNYPQYYTTYQRLPVFIQKLDFFRYLAIYHYGGFYFDVDIQPLRPLDDAVRNHQTVFPIDEYIPDCNPRFKPICERNMHFLLGQYAFGAIPKHPFLKFLVDTIHQNLDLYVNLYRKSGNNEIYVYRTTGPDFVSYVYANYVYKNQVYILENGKRQMFGDYARHDYYGSWK